MDKTMQLGDNSSVSTINVKIQNPKKILHFSDGTLEEYSDDDEVDKAIKNKKTDEIVEKELHWGPWIMHKSVKAGSSIIAGCDYVGSALSSFLGITTPKYSFEIEEIKRQQAEQELYEKEKKEAASWQETKQLNPSETITTEIKKTIEKF